MAKKYKYNNDAFGSLFSGSMLQGFGILGGLFDPLLGSLSLAQNLLLGNGVGSLDDAASQLLFGNPEASTEAWNELSGYNSQQREFEQQEYLIDKQNEYNTPANQMARMKEAGINPNLAAGGIAGSGSTSATPSAVASNVGGAAAAAQQLVGATGTVADVINKASEANERNTLLQDKQREIRANTSKILEDQGVSHWTAKSIEERLPALKSNDYADYYQKLATIDKTWQEYLNLVEQHHNISAEYNLIIANKDLIYSQKEVEDARKLLIDEQTRWQKQDNDFWENHGYRRGDPIDQSIRDCKANGKDPSFIGDSLYDYYENSEYAKQKGLGSAEMMYGSSKSPWELGDKYANRFFKFIKENIVDSPEVGKQQLLDIMDRLALEHPNWTRDDVVKQLLEFGFTNDEIYKVLNDD